MKRIPFLIVTLLALSLPTAHVAHADDAATIMNAEIGGSRCRRRRGCDLCAAGRRFHENLAGRNQWVLVHAK